jgi:hypothetical protein
MATTFDGVAKELRPADSFTDIPTIINIYAGNSTGSAPTTQLDLPRDSGCLRPQADGRKGALLGMDRHITDRRQGDLLGA